MKNISLYEPNIDDYYYEEKIQSDKDTMSYNRGYNVSYYGYHYDTGCIDFPKERWKMMFEKRKKEHRFFKYIKDNDKNVFVGYVNYQYNIYEKRYECGILIESIYRNQGYSKEAIKLLINEARNNGIKELYDSFEIDREKALQLFLSIGFEVVERNKWKKFGKDVEGVTVKIIL